MNKKLMVSLSLAAALCGAVAVVSFRQGETARAVFLGESHSVRDAEQTVSGLQSSLAFTLRELRELPAGYVLVSSALRQPPTGSANATTAILSYRGGDGGFLELTQRASYGLVRPSIVLLSALSRGR